MVFLEGNSAERAGKDQPGGHSRPIGMIPVSRLSEGQSLSFERFSNSHQKLPFQARQTARAVLVRNFRKEAKKDLYYYK